MKISAKSPLRNQKGSIALYMVIIMSVVLPMMIFLAVDLPHVVNMHRKTKNVLDNIGSSAVLALDESQLSLGRLVIIESKATQIIYQMLATEFNLDPVTLEPLAGSPLVERPTVKIRIINEPKTTQMVRLPEQNLSDQEKFEDVYVDETSIVVYVELKIQSLFFKSYQPYIRQVTAAQSQFAN